MGQFFSRKQIHKTIWALPDKMTHNQIDHICILPRFRRSLLDVRVKHVPDAATGHCLIVGKIHLKLRKHDNARVRLKCNGESLKGQLE